MATVVIIALACGGASAAGPPSGRAADKNCSDFSTQPQSQQYFESHGGSPSNDVDGLDRDHDGIACEDLPGGGNTSPPPSTPPTTVRASCRRGPHPDTKCTPGRAFAGATAKQVCIPGYSEGVRNVPQSEKDKVYAEYGIRRHAPGSYEVDHLISLELGGSNSIKNLWPEKQPGARSKDTLENRLHRQLCDGQISLRTAQRRIVKWWLYG